MTLEIAFVFALIAVIFILFLTEKFPPDLIALSALVIVALTRLITPGEAFAALANDAPISVAAMFILSSALQRSGAIEDVGRLLRRMRQVNELKLLTAMMITVTLSSCFVNNTPIVVAFMPLVLGLARHYQVNASKLLIPLSYAAIWGGTCSLIGTSTNLAVSSLARTKYGVSIGIFDITVLGLIMSVTGICYMAFLGRHLLPNRESLASIIGSTSTREYIAEVRVIPGSPLAGKKVADTELAHLAGARLQEIVREGQPLPKPFAQVVLQAEDQLTLASPINSLMEVDAMRGLELVDEKKLGLERRLAEEAVVIEGVVTNNSSYIGRTISELNLREKFHAVVLAIHRQGENIQRRLGDVPLRFGDTILLKLPEEFVLQLRDGRDLLLLSDSAIAPARRNKQPIAIAALAAVVILAALNVYPISLLAVSAAVVLVLTRTLQMSELYAAIDWRIVSMIVGMIALGTAVEKTGAAAWLADQIIATAGSASPVLVLAGFYLLATLLTELISNNAVAILMTPVAAQAAAHLELNPLPFFIAIMFAASASFATPIGYQTNTFIYGAGGYRFKDFVKVGAPLNLLFFVIAIVVIPLIWPLR